MHEYARQYEVREEWVWKMGVNNTMARDLREMGEYVRESTEEGAFMMVIHGANLQ